VTQEEDLALDETQERSQTGLGRRLLEERLAAWQLDLEDSGEQMRQDRRVIGDDDAPSG
jgi:hypothetical protein